MIQALALALVIGTTPKILTLDDKIARVLPTADEEKWQKAGWRTNLMLARREAQTAKKPIFLWIMVGNPQGCT